MFTKEDLVSVLDVKKDFYLLFLLKNDGHFFKPEELLFHREYYKRNKKMMRGTEMSVTTYWETHIPCCDELTLKDIRKRMNYLIELISACQEYENPKKLAEAESELEQLTKYVKASTVRGGRIDYFQSTHNRMKEAILKAVSRSIEKLREKDAEMADLLKKNLISKSEIGLNELSVLY